MEEFARRGPRTEHQWCSTSLSLSRASNVADKGDGRNGDGVVGLGTGALNFIRNRGSVRRQNKRDSSSRNKPSNEGHSTSLSTDTVGGGGGGSNGSGGFGKWLRDHLGGGARNSQEIVPFVPLKKRPSNTSYDLTSAGTDKNLTRTTYTPQNLYCSLPREQHRRHFRGAANKSNIETAREQRPRCHAGAEVAAIANYRERSEINGFNVITRGGPVYGSEGKSSRRREREKRRHSMNETKANSRHRRISVPELVALLEPVELSPKNSDPRLDDQTAVEAPKGRSKDKVADNYSGSYEEPLQESEDDEEGKSIDKSETREEDQEDAREGFDQSYFYRNDHEESEQHEERKRETEDAYEDDEEEEEEGEDEREVYPTKSRPGGPEKPDVTEDIQPSHFDDFDVGVLSDISLEILRDRHALIEKLYELKKDEPDLRTKNRLLQYWVARVMSKKRQTMTPDDERLIETERDERYVKTLYSYKRTIDEFEARKVEMRNELDIVENEVKTVLDEDAVTFGELLAREREVGLGLVYEETGRVISDNAIDAAIRRKVLRRDLLNVNRFKYIFYRHRYEDARAKLRLAEKLGVGMTIMDYEVIRMENDSYKEKLEERDKHLEKLRNKIEYIVSTLAHYKEKDVENIGEISYETECRELVRLESLRTREGLNQVHKLLWRIRNACANERRRAGMLFAIPVVREMEKTMKSLNEVRTEIERLSPGGWPVRPVGGSRNKLGFDENRRTVTRMTGVKSEGTRKTRPGRC